MVSIIIPVYNVENYIDRCLESVVKQTYTDIEILVMEAKSTDRSLEKVLAWARDDDRFTIVSRRDGGLGPARNYALQIARGEFVLFLDSDDWLDLDFVEKAVRIVQSEAEIDIVMTGFYLHTDLDNRINICMNPWENGVYGDLSMKKNIMVYGNNSMWSKLFRKELFTKYEIIQPALPYEDLAVYPTLVAAARKIAVCNDAFFHYLAYRPGSLFGNKASCYRYSEVMEYAEKVLKKVAYDKFSPVFQLCMYKHFFNAFRQVFGGDQYKTAIEQELSKSFYRERFRVLEAVSGYQFVVYGGFPSRWAVHRLSDGKKRLVEHFTFTSLIAQMCGQEAALEVYHSNPFRQHRIAMDLQKGYRQWLTRKEEQAEDTTIYIIDFLNECQDIAQISNDCYITLSEALTEAVPDIKEDYPIISWESENYWNLWKAGCQKLIRLIQENDISHRVVLFQYGMADCYKEDGEIKPYQNRDEILRKNQTLQKMYAYFLEGMPEVKHYDFPKELNYTDVTGQEFTPCPEYLNSFVYNSAYQRMEIDFVEEQYV